MARFYEGFRETVRKVIRGHRTAPAVALGGSAGDNDEQDAVGQRGDGQLSLQHHSPVTAPMAGSRAIRVPHAVAIMCRSASISRAYGSTGSINASTAAAASVPGVRWPADAGNRGGDGDGDGERQSAGTGEPVADPLGEHHVDGPPDGCQGGEADTGKVDDAVPLLTGQMNSDQRQPAGRLGARPAPNAYNHKSTVVRLLYRTASSGP